MSLFSVNMYYIDCFVCDIRDPFKMAGRTSALWSDIQSICNG